MGGGRVVCLSMLCWRCALQEPPAIRVHCMLMQEEIWSPYCLLPPVAQHQPLAYRRSHSRKKQSGLDNRLAVTFLARYATPIE
jgi:hypothetical protein